MGILTKVSGRSTISTIDTVVDRENPFFRLADHSSSFRHITTDHGIKSYEGFYKNEAKQRQAAAELADLLEFHGKVLDVGYGSNIYVASQLARQGMDAYALDLEPLALMPEVTVFKGDAAILGKKKNGVPNNLNTITYWGSWFSRGNAQHSIIAVFGVPSVENYIAATSHNDSSRIGRNAEHTDIFLKAEQEMLKGAVNQLSYGGQIVAVSNRYSYADGPSFLFEELPYEKRRMLHLADVLSQLGAEKITFVGVSEQGMNKLAAEHEEQYLLSYKKAHLLGNTPYDVNGIQMQKHEMNDEDVMVASHSGWTNDELTEQGRGLFLLTLDRLFSENCLVEPSPRAYSGLSVGDPSPAEKIAVQSFRGVDIARIDAISARFYK